MGLGDYCEERENGKKIDKEKLNKIINLNDKKEQINEDELIKSIQSDSPSSLYKILKFNLKNVLDGKKIKFNKLLNIECMGDDPIHNTFATKLSVKIEESFRGPKGGAIVFTEPNIQKMIDLIAQENAFHPVVDYVNSLPIWDRTPRIEKVIKEILGAEEKPLFQVFIKKFFISLIARPLNPGMQKDEVFILFGDQGIGKTTFFRIIGGKWHSDDSINLRDVGRAYDTINSCWLYEFSELGSLKKGDNDSVKLFLSKKFDKIRKAYDRRQSYWARQSVAVGSTNDERFLTDPTGSRRYWIVPCNKIDNEKLKDWKEQLLAEAKFLYESGEKTFLTTEEYYESEDNNKKHQVYDTWMIFVKDYIETKCNNDYVRVENLIRELKKDPGTWKDEDQKRITNILGQMGYRGKTIREGKDVFWAWSKKSR